jgi:hypothetical protein
MKNLQIIFFIKRVLKPAVEDYIILQIIKNYLKKRHYLISQAKNHTT